MCTIDAVVRFIAIVASLLMLCSGRSAFAQNPPCTAAPPPPPSVTMFVNSAIAARPAAVSITWAGVPFSGTSAVTTYIIEVGSASGLADVARAEVGGQTVTYSHAAADGTYHIRIRSKNACGISPPSSEMMVIVSGSPFNAQPTVRPILPTSQVGQDNLGNVMVMGEISGTWGAPAASFVKVTGTFTGPLGASLGSDFTYVYGRSRRLQTSRIVDDSTIGPAETACFALYTDIPFSQVKGLTISTTVSLAAVDGLTGNAAIEGYRQGSDSLGGLKIGGLLRNTGGVTTYFNQVITDVRDAQNRVLDCDFAPVDGSRLQLASGGSTQTALTPAQSGPFQAYSRAAYFYMDRVLTWSTWVEADPAMPDSLSWRAVAADAPARVNDDPKERTRARNKAIAKLRDMSLELDGK